MSETPLADVVPKVPAALRLRASRERLRDAMTPPPEPKEVFPPAVPKTWLGRLWRKACAYPVVGEVSGAIGDWWAHHPMRPAMRVASSASAVAVGPVAQRHPYALVLAAGGFGALLVWTRPWKWALRSALFAGLVPQLASQLLKKLPIDTWLTMLGTVIASQTRPVAPPPESYPAAFVPSTPAPLP